MGNNVIVYSTPTCPYCIKAKKFLKDNDIAFDDIDVSQDHAMAQEMIDKSGQMGVPVLEIYGKIVIGFDEPAIRKALGI